MEPVPLSKAIRTSSRKVRTGCITCKKRHVKCDEARPFCSNCLTSRGHCEGYASKLGRKPSAKRTIHMRPDASSQSTYPLWPIAQVQLGTEHGNVPSSFNMLYYREFLALMQNPWMTGLSNSEGQLWKETMPQICHNDLILRSAAMAVGAMSLWRQNVAINNKITPSRLLMTDPRYVQALAFYGQALKLQSRRQAPFRSAAFLSLLLLMFESLRIQRRSALQHVNHGMALLLSLVAGPRADGNIHSFAPNPRPVVAQLADVFTHLATQTRVILQGRLGQHSPLPNLAVGLAERDMSMESFLVLLSRVATKKPHHIPSVFNSLDEFEEHWVSLTRAQAEMGPIMHRAMEDAKILEAEDQQHIIGTFPHFLRDSKVQDFCNNARREMRILEHAFMPIFTRITMSVDMDSPSYLRAILLRLRYLAVYIFNNPPQYCYVDAMVALEPRFREFISLAEVMLRICRAATFNPAHQFCIDGGLAWHLLLAALHCRNPVTRDEATILLREYPGQDGLWNTRALHALASRNRAVERQNANEDAEQVQWQRLWRREFYLENGGERLIFRFLERNERSGEWALVEEVAEFEDHVIDVEWQRQATPQSGKLLLKRAIPSRQ